MNLRTVTEADAVEVTPGRRRRLIATENLMVVAWEFDNGPWNGPDPPHAHPHEQVAYIAEGEVLFFLGEEVQRLRAGDMVAIPPDIPHCIQLISHRVRMIDSFTPLRNDFL